jgi:3-phenylpropionate/cinnamic acid dioxygenase small subunit
MLGSAPTALDAALQAALENFLYEEAELLDQRRFRDWLGLLSEDVHYWVPAPLNYSLREQDLAVPDPDRLAHYDDDIASLTMRVRRLESNMAWSEEPPSRTRRFVSNVRVVGRAEGQGSGALEVTSNILVYQNRLEREVNLFAGQRHDVLRPRRDSFEIARRRVQLDQTVVLAKSLSVFF